MVTIKQLKKNLRRGDQKAILQKDKTLTRDIVYDVISGKNKSLKSELKVLAAWEKVVSDRNSRLYKKNRRIQQIINSYENRTSAQPHRAIASN